MLGRAGTTATFDELNKYFTISNMQLSQVNIGIWFMAILLKNVKKDEEVYK